MALFLLLFLRQNDFKKTHTPFICASSSCPAPPQNLFALSTTTTTTSTTTATTATTAKTKECFFLSFLGVELIASALSLFPNRHRQLQRQQKKKDKTMQLKKNKTNKQKHKTRVSGKTEKRTNKNQTVFF